MSQEEQRRQFSSSFITPNLQFSISNFQFSLLF